MPPIPRRREAEANANAPPKKSLSDALAGAFLNENRGERARPEAKPSGPWKRSGRGNLTRTFDGLRVTVFSKDWGYRWCITDGEEERYSDTTLPTEEEAAADVMRLLGVEE